jgi:hypothetical protein
MRSLGASTEITTVPQAWLEMPADYDAPTSAGRARHPTKGSPLIIYRDSKAYVLCRDEDCQRELIRYHDVRLLTDAEARTFEDGLPIPLRPSRSGGEVGLGDLVHRLTTMARIAECTACSKRRSVLNKVVVWGWWKTSRT